MTLLARCTSAALAAALLSACAITPPSPAADPSPPGSAVRREAAARLCAVIVSDRSTLDPWMSAFSSQRHTPDDADGGSGIPISPDGYFLTADHVLARSSGKNVFIIHTQQGPPRPTRARIVWRSASSDLALLHIPLPTPRHYQWTDPDQWLPLGTPVMHYGIATGHRSRPGKLVTPVPPGRPARFKHDIPLEPGDSGGAVIDAQGRLVGVNSAVEFLIPIDTAFFIESEANRPNLRGLQRVIGADRRRHPSPTRLAAATP